MFGLESREGVEIFGVTFREFGAFWGQVINIGFCFFANDTAHRRHGNPKRICNSAIINPLTEEIRGHCHSKVSYFIIRGRNWLDSFAKDGRESRKLAINSASHLPSATYHFPTNASIIFSRLLWDSRPSQGGRISLAFLCMHCRVCIISLTRSPSWVPVWSS